MAALDPLELYPITKVFAVLSLLIHWSSLLCLWTELRLSFSWGYPKEAISLCSWCLPPLYVRGKSLQQIEHFHFQPGKLGQMGYFGRQLWAIWTSWIRSKAELVTPIVCLVPFYFFSLVLCSSWMLTQWPSLCRWLQPVLDVTRATCNLGQVSMSPPALLKSWKQYFLAGPPLPTCW